MDVESSCKLMQRNYNIATARAVKLGNLVYMMLHELAVATVVTAFATPTSSAINTNFFHKGQWLSITVP